MSSSILVHDAVLSTAHNFHFGDDPTDTSYPIHRDHSASTYQYLEDEFAHIETHAQRYSFTEKTTDLSDIIVRRFSKMVLPNHFRKGNMETCPTVLDTSSSVLFSFLDFKYEMIKMSATLKHIKNAWIGDYIEYVDDLLALDKNWNNASADKVEKQNAVDTISMISEIAEIVTDCPIVYPSDEGGVVTEFKKDGNILTVVVEDQEAHIMYMIKQDMDSVVFASQDIENIANLISSKLKSM